MSFEIDIRVDPSQAVPAIKRVETELDKVEKQGPRAGAAVTAGMREGAAGADRASSSTKGLGEQLGKTNRSADVLSRSFGRLNEQFARESRLLEAIRGPAREHAADLRALEMLYKRGAISAHEFATEQRALMDTLARSNAARGMANGPAASGGMSLAGLGGRAMGALGGALAGKQLLELSDVYTSLENRLRQVASSQSDLNSLMERTKAIADSTRSDWASTGEAFVRLTNATKQLGVSQDRALKITETLNMALQSSGASANEAAAGTLQLMQALSAGALQGDEFRSIGEQLPDLLDLFAKELKVSRGELKKLGAEGKITADVVVRSLESASGSIRDKFMASTATAAQQWTVLKNEMTLTAGEFVRNTGIIETLGSVLRGTMEVITPLISVVGKLAGALGSLNDVTKAVGVDLKLAFAGLLVGGPIGAGIGALVSVALDGESALDALGTAMKNIETYGKADVNMFDMWRHMVERANDPVVRLARSAQTLHDALEALNNVTARAQVAGILASFADTQKVLDRHLKQRRAGGQRVAPLDPDNGARNLLLPKSGAPNIGMGIGDLSLGPDPMLDAAMKQVRAHGDALRAHAAFVNNELAAAYEKWGQSSEHWTFRVNRAWEELNDGALQELRSSVLSLGDALVDSLLEAEFTWKRFIEQMSKDLLKSGIRGILNFAMNSAFGGGGGGGMNWEAIANAAQSQTPRAATGGSWTVGGSGGTDSQVAMLRVTPRETISVHTPGQVEQAERSSGGSRRVVHELPDGRRATYVLEDDVEELVLRVIDRNEPMLRSRLTGR